MGVQCPMSSGSRRNSSNPKVPSGRAKISTQRSTDGVDGLANTVQDGSSRADMRSRLSSTADSLVHRPVRALGDSFVEFRVP
jgi:hypothetical protein